MGILGNGNSRKREFKVTGILGNGVKPKPLISTRLRLERKRSKCTNASTKRLNPWEILTASAVSNDDIWKTNFNIDIHNIMSSTQLTFSRLVSVIISRATISFFNTHGVRFAFFIIPSRALARACAVTGLLFPPANVQRWAYKIKKLIFEYQNLFTHLT